MTIFSEDGRIDSFTVTTSGTYTISAIGATGGGLGPGYAGGAGAEVSASFSLPAGNVIEILVGGAGGVAGTDGGGGSFVAAGATGAALAGGVNTGGNGSVTISAVACYLSGTRILTDKGEVAVEALAVGDRVPVLLGGRLARVRWVGQRQIDCQGHPTRRAVWPIRVCAGAFGPGSRPTPASPRGLATPAPAPN